MTESLIKPFRPQLAAETPLLNVHTGEVDWKAYEPHLPMFGSYKVDGIRGAARWAKLISRSGKPIPSSYAQKFFGTADLHGFDGELTAQKRNPGQTVYQDAFSAVMTHGCQDPLFYDVFDFTDSILPYNRRYEDLQVRVAEVQEKLPQIRLLEQRMLGSIQDILDMEQEALDAEYEGLIVRRPDAPYKQGRSTLKQGFLIKVARTMNSEAEVIGFEELMHNDNEAKQNEVGYTKRSSHKANLRSSGMLGAFLCRDLKTGVEFKVGIGEGMDHAFRKHVWENQAQYLGRIMKYSFKPYGTAMKPRQPKWLGWRSKEDM